MTVESGGIARNLAALESRMKAACERSGRAPASVRLVAVTKTVDTDAVRVLNSLGVTDFGESRVQELVRKAVSLEDLPLRWHMIGHLQRNKIKHLLPHSRTLHSLDSRSLAEDLSRRAAEAGLEMNVLIELNVSGEETKYGARPEEAAGLAEGVVKLPALRLCGLMTLAPVTDDPEKVRPLFADLRELADTLARNLPPGAMSELSMGMTQDFEVAIEEGATMVRIGSGLFA